MKAFIMKNQLSSVSSSLLRVVTVPLNISSGSKSFADTNNTDTQPDLTEGKSLRCEIDARFKKAWRDGWLSVSPLESKQGFFSEITSRYFPIDTPLIKAIQLLKDAGFFIEPVIEPTQSNYHKYRATLKDYEHGPILANTQITFELYSYTPSIETGDDPFVSRVRDWVSITHL